MNRRVVMHLVLIGSAIFSASVVDSHWPLNSNVQSPNPRACGVGEKLLRTSTAPVAQAPIQLSATDMVVAEPESGRLLVVDRDRQGNKRTVVLAVQLEEPRGVALECEGNCILVAEGAAGRITRISVGETVTKQVVYSGLNRPEGVALDCAGDLLVTTFGDGCLWRVARDGSSAVVLAEGLNGPVGVAVGRGSIFVAESLSGCLLRLSADGSNRWRVVDGLVGPAMIAWGRNELVYVAEAGGGQITEVHPQTGERRVVARDLDRPVGIGIPDELDGPPVRLWVTHDNEVASVNLSNGDRRPEITGIHGAGCAVVPGTLLQRSDRCSIAAACERVDKTLTVRGRVTCFQAAACAPVELRVVFNNRTFLGPLKTTSDPDGNFEFRNPPFSVLTDDRVPGGGSAQVLVGPSCGYCRGNVRNQCRF